MYARLPAVAIVAAVAAGLAGCAHNPRASLPGVAREPDAATIVHLLNRIGYGPRPGDPGNPADAGDIVRIQRIGIAAFIDQQLHPEAIADVDLDWRLQPLTSRTIDARAFAVRYYLPMS